MNFVGWMSGSLAEDGSLSDWGGVWGVAFNHSPYKRKAT